MTKCLWLSVEILSFVLFAFVLYYLIFIENQSLSTLDSINKQIIIIIIAYARVKKGAHKIIQVIAGYIIGLVLAHYIVFLEKNL